MKTLNQKIMRLMDNLDCEELSLIKGLVEASKTMNDHIGDKRVQRWIREIPEVQDSMLFLFEWFKAFEAWEASNVPIEPATVPDDELDTTSD